MVVWSKKRSFQQFSWFFRNGILPTTRLTLSVPILCDSVLKRIPLDRKKLKLQSRFFPIFCCKNPAIFARQAFEDLAQSGMSGPEAEAQVGCGRVDTPCFNVKFWLMDFMQEKVGSKKIRLSMVNPWFKEFPILGLVKIVSGALLRLQKGSFFESDHVAKGGSVF